MFKRIGVFGVIVLLSSAALAAPAKVPNCGIDADRDGYCVPDPSTLMVVTPEIPAVPAVPAVPSTSSDPGSAEVPAVPAVPAVTGPRILGVRDCNDSDAGRNPAAREIVADGIDQDCNGRDLTYSIADAVARNFGCNPKDARCMDVLDDELDICIAATTAQCQVAETRGKFALKRGFYFMDTDCNGRREVIDQVAYDTFLAKKRADFRIPNWEPRPDGRCIAGCQKVPSSTTCGGGSGSVTGSGKKLVAASKKLEDEQNEALKALRKSTDGIETTLKDHETRLTEDRTLIGQLVELNTKMVASVNGLNTRMDDVEQNGRVTDERVMALEVEDAVKKALIGGAQATADAAYKNGLTLGSTGPLFELSLGSSFLFQSAIDLEDENGDSLGQARGNVAPTLEVGLNLGYQLQDVRYFARLRVGAAWDKGPSDDFDAGLMYSAGAVGEWRVSGDNFLGGHLTYFAHEAGGDVLKANGLSRAVLVGPRYTFLVDPDGPSQYGISVNAGVGPESSGTEGVGLRSVDIGALWMLNLEFGAGVGPIWSNYAPRTSKD